MRLGEIREKLWGAKNIASREPISRLFWKEILEDSVWNLPNKLVILITNFTFARSDTKSRYFNLPENSKLSKYLHWLCLHNPPHTADTRDNCWRWWCHHQSKRDSTTSHTADTYFRYFKYPSCWNCHIQTHVGNMKIWYSQFTLGSVKNCVVINFTAFEHKICKNR